MGFDTRQAQVDELRTEIAELKSKPPMYIKVDETTEAFIQTHAANENMKMYQKEAIELRQVLYQTKNERDRLKTIAERMAGALREANQLCRSAFYVSSRAGRDTNWWALTGRLKDDLENQIQALAEWDAYKKGEK